MVYVCAENFVGIEVRCWRGQISIITVQNSPNGMLNILWFKRAFGQPSSWPFPACLFLQSTQLQAPPILTTAHIFLSRPPAFVPHSLTQNKSANTVEQSPWAFLIFICFLPTFIPSGFSFPSPKLIKAFSQTKSFPFQRNCISCRQENVSKFPPHIFMLCCFWHNSLIEKKKESSKKKCLS